MQPMMDRQLIRYFLAVIDTGTFSGAAGLCRVSQPTVSAGIMRLEESLGQMLFNRSNRRVELTPAGARLEPHARRIEAEFGEARRAVAEVEPSQLIRLGVAGTIATALIERIAVAARAVPGLTLEFVERRPSETMGLLDRGRTDLILTPVSPADERPAIALFAERYVLAMAGDHPLVAESIISSDQLGREAMLVRRQCEALAQVSQFFTARGIRPFMAARSVSEDRIASYVRAGLGVTVMPESLLQHGIAGRPLVGLDLRRTVAIVVHPQSASRIEQSGIAAMIAAAAAEQ